MNMTARLFLFSVTALLGLVWVACGRGNPTATPVPATTPTATSASPAATRKPSGGRREHRGVENRPMLKVVYEVP